MSDEQKVKKYINLRHCEIVIYKEYLKVDIQKTIKEYNTIKHWAYILHDKDDTDPHYHIYLHFGSSSVRIDLIAKWFKLGYIDKDGNEQDGTQFIEKVKGRRVDVLLYLTHGNDSQKNKYQYSPTEVTANFDFESEIAQSKIIGDFENYSYCQQVHYVNMLPVSEKTKAHSQLKKLWQLECEILATKTDRNIEVIFITGKGGTGKTLYAKKMLEKLNYDYCISSSSNDPFQDYMGQRAIILDDLRDTSFEMADLLKLLDNNTRSSVKSRFANKVFNGKMIIITSAVPIQYWYTAFRINRKYDELNQLYRRISTYIEVTENAIQLYDGVNENGKPKDCIKVLPNDLVKEFRSKIQKTNLVDVLEDVLIDNANKKNKKELIQDNLTSEAEQEKLDGLKGYVGV